jgi:hypothetical protein
MWRRLGRAEGGGTRVHVDGGHEGARDHRGAGADELGIGHARQDLGQDLREGARDRNGGHGAAHDEGRDDRGLIVSGIDLERAHHDAVEDERRVDVDERGHHGVLLDEVRPKRSEAMSTESCARSGAVTEPHEGLV